MKIVYKYTTGVLLISLAVATNIANASIVTGSRAKSSSASTLTNRFTGRSEHISCRGPRGHRGIEIIGNRQLQKNKNKDMGNMNDSDKRPDKGTDDSEKRPNKGMGDSQSERRPTSPDPESSPECVALFDDCRSDEDCCDDDHDCDDGQCCVREGSPCGRDRECCDGNCNNGRCRDCVELLDDCRRDGDCCEDDHECRDNQCCITIGGRCGDDEECCEKNCENGRCRKARIDLMASYTQAALRHVAQNVCGEDPNNDLYVKRWLAKRVQETNSALEEAGVNAEIRVVYTRLWPVQMQGRPDFREASLTQQAIGQRFRACNGDSIFSCQEVRDYGADVVALIYHHSSDWEDGEETTNSLASYILVPLEGDNACGRVDASDAFTFSHEFGHVFVSH